LPGADGCTDGGADGHAGANTTTHCHVAADAIAVASTITGSHESTNDPGADAAAYVGTDAAAVVSSHDFGSSDHDTRSHLGSDLAALRVSDLSRKHVVGSILERTAGHRMQRSLRLLLRDRVHQ
jgi:hypothetical protein